VTSRRSLPPGSRGLRLSDTPLYSIVVASQGEAARLHTLLAALVPVCRDRGAEVVAVRACSTDEFRDWQRGYPSVLWMPAPDTATAKQLRVAGLTACEGDIVALVSDAIANDEAALAGLLAGQAAPAGGRVGRPELSVVIPSHQSMHRLRRCLEAIEASEGETGAREIVVVDDASTDESSLVAAEFADVVVRLAGKAHGPAFARNRGFEASHGDVVVFVDADVVLHPDALARIAADFRADPALGAVFGSYDAEPEAAGTFSEYRHLRLHFTHQRRGGPSDTFWTGIGAVRSDVFAGVGMFDEWAYARPKLEDVELGQRLRRFGHSIRLDPAVQGTHLNRWTLGSSVATGFRAAALTIAARAQRAPTGTEGASGFFALVGVALVIVGCLTGRPALAAEGALAFLIAVLLDLPFYAYLARARGAAFLAAAIPLQLLHDGALALATAAGWVAHHLLGEPAPPADVSAHAQLGVPTWPPPPRRPAPRAPERRGSADAGR